MPLRSSSVTRRSLILAGLLVLWAAPAAAADWDWPVRGAVIERFRLGPDPFAAGQHRGIDIAAPAGRAVRSACTGTVTFAGVVGAGGRTVSVRCGALTATYQHMSAIAVHRGDSLRIGARLGAVGRTGHPRSPAAHLHFGVHRTADRHAYLDPLSLLGGGGGRQVPLLPPAPRPRGGAPHAFPTNAPGRRFPIRGPVAAREEGVPVVVWVGVGLVLIGLPGTGLRRRRRSAAIRRATARRALASG